MKLRNKIFLSTIILLTVTGCSRLEKISSPLPSKQIYINHVKKVATISLFALNNYTDTPDAGLRASNIIYGVLEANGYNVIQHTFATSFKLSNAIKIAKKDKANYLMYGGVSEWRYKTGIDAQPAISIQCSLIDIKTSKVIWSATASDNSWGNSSIGTTAQKLIESILKN